MLRSQPFSTGRSEPVHDDVEDVGQRLAAKPDVVMEGGNVGKDALGAVLCRASMC